MPDGSLLLTVLHNFTRLFRQLCFNLITIDADAWDTAIAPGVLFTSPGGLTFDETTDLLNGIARKGPIVGLNLFEVRPERDINDITASTAAQLIIHFIGTLVHTGQIGR